MLLISQAQEAIGFVLDGRLSRMENQVCVLAKHDFQKVREACLCAVGKFSDRDAEWAAKVVIGFVLRYQEGKF